MKRLLVITTLMLLVAAPAAAQRDTTPGENLGGYDTAGTGAAISFQPFLPALVSTGDVPFEVTFGHSTSRVKSGGTALGRGALVWPGSTAADLGPVLGAGFGQDALGALIPKWPLQANANQDSGIVETGVPPIATMRAEGYPDKAVGDAHYVDIHVPRLVQVEKVASTSTSIVTDQSVTSVSRVTLTGVSLLAGYVKAESIRSISRTTSIGGAGSSSGDVDIEGMTIGGAEVSVTDDGFHVTGLPPGFEQAPGAGEEPFPNASPEEAVASILANLGARITLFNGASKVAGGKAEHIEPGLVLSLDNPVGGQGPIPPGRFDIFLASAASSAVSSLPFSADTPDVDVPDTLGGDSDADGGSFSIGEGPKVASETVSNVGDGLTGAAEGSLGAIGADVLPQRSDYAFDGLPLGLVITLLLAALIASRYIRNYFNSMMTAGGPRRGEE